MGKKITIIAGEPSGDLHGSHLIKNLKEISPEIEISGLGGSQMKAAGAEIYYDLTNLAVIGFFEVLKNIDKFKSAFKLLLKKIDQVKPDVVVLIDYPGFNLKIAKEIKKRNISIIYYISPQVWAWGKNRIKTIRKLVDKMIVLFKFEEDLYKKEKIDAYFAGHPLIDIVKPVNSKDETFLNYNLDSSKPIITLMPGSRENEICKNLPIMLESANLIHRKIQDAQFLLIQSNSAEGFIYEQEVKKSNLPVRLIVNNVYDILNITDFALICSGTATLEATILTVPMAIIYKVSFLSWLFIRSLIRIPYIGLVNIIANKKIVPEFIQYDARPEKISEFVVEYILNRDKIDRMKGELSKVRNLLGPPGASRRAAEYIIDFLNQG